MVTKVMGSYNLHRTHPDKSLAPIFYAQCRHRNMNRDVEQMQQCFQQAHSKYAPGCNAPIPCKHTGAIARYIQLLQIQACISGENMQNSLTHGAHSEIVQSHGFRLDKPLTQEMQDYP